MSISRKFSLLVLAIVAVTVAVNVTALRYFAGRYFSEYLTTVPDRSVLSFDTNTRSANADLSVLDNLSLHQEALPEVLERYKTINDDLSRISQALSDYVDASPEINRAPGTPAPLPAGARATPLGSFFASLTRLARVDADSPEFRFVTQVFESILVVNAILTVIVLAATYAFMDATFSPIWRIVAKVRDIAHRGRSERIEYSRKDEFGTLVEAVNELGEKLSRQEAIRSRFLADVSHEIKTPITSVKCYMEGIRDGVIQLDEGTVKAVVFELDRLTRITQAIMEFQKLENDDVNLRYEMVDFPELLSFVESNWAQRLAKNGQRVVYSRGRKFQVFFDKDRLAQVAHNVIGNFIKYAGAGTNLYVSWSLTKDGYRLSFADNGRGVDRKEIPFLTEKFYQADSSKSGDIEDRGIGVGLSIVRKIVDAAGGDWRIDSDAGKGFRIEVTLPRLVQK